MWCAYMCAISENKPLKQRNLFCMCVNVMSLRYSKVVAIDSYLRLILNNNNNCINGRVHYSTFSNFGIVRSCAPKVLLAVLRNSSLPRSAPVRITGTRIHMAYIYYNNICIYLSAESIKFNIYLV